MLDDCSLEALDLSELRRWSLLHGQSILGSKAKLLHFLDLLLLRHPILLIQFLICLEESFVVDVVLLTETLLVSCCATREICLLDEILGVEEEQ